MPMSSARRSSTGSASEAHMRGPGRVHGVRLRFGVEGLRSKIRGLGFGVEGCGFGV
jgi:hypothetical protein